MQQDVVSVPARRFQDVLRRWKPPARAAGIVGELTGWDARLTTESRPALIYEVWISRLPAALFGRELGARVDLRTVLETLEAVVNEKALLESLDQALAEISRRLGPNQGEWSWGRLHRLHLRHPLGVASLNRGPVARPGDGNTVNSTSGANFLQTNGASYRQILDLSDWDRSVMTMVPGESGDPLSRHYDDLLEAWAEGRYHPMPFSRREVEAAAVERTMLAPR
jgi:penicillin amidase